jgi:hypothetical protein
VTNASSWSLERGGGDWTAPKPLGARAEGTVYSLHVGARDNSGTAGSVLFTLADLKAMAPVRCGTTTTGEPRPVHLPPN